MFSFFFQKIGEAVLTSTHNLCFEQKYEKYQSFLSEKKKKKNKKKKKKKKKLSISQIILN